MSHPERSNGNETRGPEVSREATDRATELARTKHEVEKPHEREARVESARHEALKQAEAIAGPEHAAAEKEAQSPLSESTPKNNKQRETSFRQTMRSAQSKMSAPERTFSKIIHNPIVERVSDTISTTIARPDAIVSGALCAFLAVLSLYLTARYVGFALSGFETIGAFIVGWVIGMGYDFIKSVFPKNK